MTRGASSRSRHRARKATPFGRPPIVDAPRPRIRAIDALAFHATASPCTQLLDISCRNRLDSIPTFCHLHLFASRSCIVPVLPLTFKGKPTVADTREAFVKAGAEDGTTILIQGMDAEQLTGKSSNVSYDLRIGKEYRDHRDPGKYNLPDNGPLTLHPGSAVIIQTEESVHLPRTLFALVVPKVGLLQQGLSNTMSKVDPGYQGHLLVTLFNLGQTTVTLRRGTPFCSLCVLRVDEGARLYDKPGQSITGQARRRWWYTCRDFLQRNNPALTGLLLLATLMLFISQLFSK